MNTFLTVGLASIVVVAYFALSMLLHGWFTSTMVDWTYQRGLTLRWGLISMYRWVDLVDDTDPSGEGGLGFIVALLALALVPFALLELGLRLLLRRFHPTTPTTLLV